MDGSRFDDLTRALSRKSTRRRTLAGIAGIVTGGLFARSASARTLTICHATGNTESPYESLDVSQAEFNLHVRHGDFLRVECCADRDCASLDGLCGAGTCQNGYCVQLPEAAGTPCESGLLCTENDVCDGAFTCVPGDTLVCDGGDQCHTSSCDPDNGNCVSKVLVDGPCTTAYGEEGACNEQGECLGLACGDGPGCAIDEICINDGCFQVLNSETEEICMTQPVPCMALGATDPGYPGLQFCVYATGSDYGTACHSNAQCGTGEICVTITTSSGTFSRCTSHCP